MRKLSMCVVELPDGPKTKGFPFKHNDIMVMIGELEYMPGIAWWRDRATVECLSDTTQTTSGN